MHPADCPKFNVCSAPICPLDPLWPQAAHLSGERVCRYLLASGKEGAVAHFRDDAVFPLALEVLSAIRESHPIIARRVDQAARLPLKKPPGRGQHRDQQSPGVP